MGGDTRPVIAALLAVAALAAYPPPKTQGLTPGDTPDVGAVVIPRRLRRPLHLPRLGPAADCPVSSRRDVDPQFSPGLGTGPAYPAGFDDESTLHYGGANFPPPWTGNKVLWYVDPAYGGPVLIRGHQLGGPWWVGFDGFGRRPYAEIRIGPGPRGRWRERGSYTRVRAPGCYAYQVDGLIFSRVIVFRAAP